VDARDALVTRLEAVLPGVDLRRLAAREGVTLELGGRRNKGWVGQTIERVAGLAAGSAARPDGGDYELKTTTLLRDGDRWKPKETIKVTMLNPQALLEEELEASLLWRKLARLVVVGVEHGDDGSAVAVRIRAFDTEDPELVDGIRAYWDELRRTIAEGALPDVIGSHGTSDGWLQLRGTGTGREPSVCPITGRPFPAQAFYATKRFVRRMLAL
jgi:DNA mismatch repair protein MutH